MARAQPQHVGGDQPGPSPRGQFLFQQGQNQQRGMSFVQVRARHLVIAQVMGERHDAQADEQVLPNDLPRRDGLRSGQRNTEQGQEEHPPRRC